jgi:methylated-DNA-[protein]-cysteine S-methyltransferase
MKIESILGSIGNEFGDELVQDLLRRTRDRLDKALKHIRRPQVAVGVVNSPLGDLLVAMSARGIVLNHYLSGAADLAATIAKLRSQFDPIEDQQSVLAISPEVRSYLAGNATALRQKVDLSLVETPFQKKILGKLQAVPRGAVISYQALGAAAGVQNGARAVANALHNNPVPIYLPCHRVISSDGQIGGYAGGTARKLQLLHSEGFAVDKRQARIPDSILWGHTGTRIFCRESCPTATHADRKRILFFADARQATRAGMRPCENCRPAQNSPLR